MSRVGGATKLVKGTNLFYALPLDPKALIDSSFYLDSFDSKPNIKVQAVLMKCISVQERKMLKDRSHPAVVEDGDLTKEDAVHTHLLLSRSQVSRLGQLDLAMALNRIAPNFFRAYVRYIVNLPQLLRLGGGVMDERTGCLSDICQCEHAESMTLDPTGDHICSSCTSDAVSRQRAHRSLAEAIHWAAHRAACASELEQKMTATLLNQYTDLECRTIFPKNPSAEANKRAAKTLELTLELADTEEEDEEKRATIKAQLAALRAKTDNKTAGRRLDVTIKNLENKVVWVDTSLVHSTSASYIVGAEKLVRDIATAEDKEANHGIFNETVGIPSTGVNRHVKYKTAKYRVLDTIADLQVQQGWREEKPEFLACCISHLGEFSQPVFELVGFLAGSLHHAVATGAPRRDGRTAAQVVGQFKNELKNVLIAAVAKGFGLMLATGGIASDRRVRAGG